MRENSRKFGVIDKSGRWVVPCEYDLVLSAPRHLFVAKRQNKFEILSAETAKVVGSFPENCIEVWPFDDSAKKLLAAYKFAVANSGLKWGYCDLEGKIAIQPSFDAVECFSEDQAQVQIVDSTVTRRSGTIDRNGNWLLKPFLVAASPPPSAMPPTNQVVLAQAVGAKDSTGIREPARKNTRFTFWETKHRGPPSLDQVLMDHNIIGMPIAELRTILNRRSNIETTPILVPIKVVKVVRFDMTERAGCIVTLQGLLVGLDADEKVVAWSKTPFRQQHLGDRQCCINKCPIGL